VRVIADVGEIVDGLGPQVYMVTSAGFFGGQRALFGGGACCGGWISVHGLWRSVKWRW